MNNELISHWKRLLQPVFQDGSEFEIINPDASDFRARVCWQIESDPDRPNKMSKTILIIVSAEAASDYENKTDAQQQSDDMKLQEFAKSKLDNHNPDHDNPREVDPPVVGWVADSTVLNS